jgi:phosphate transport system ATP-binding protein
MNPALPYIWFLVTNPMDKLICTMWVSQPITNTAYTAFMFLGDMVEFGGAAQIFDQPVRQETRDYINGIFG